MILLVFIPILHSGIDVHVCVRVGGGGGGGGYIREENSRGPLFMKQEYSLIVCSLKNISFTTNAHFLWN